MFDTVDINTLLSLAIVLTLYFIVVVIIYNNRF